MYVKSRQPVQEPVEYVQDEYYEEYEQVMEPVNKSKVVRMPRKATQKVMKSQPLADQDFTPDDWVGIQKKIDLQYEKKLKEVGDTALKKLKSY